MLHFYYLAELYALQAIHIKLCYGFSDPGGFIKIRGGIISS